jgi:flagellar biosynthetic protein FlhB
MSEQKTEKASQQRKNKAREKGDGVRSRELNSAFAMLAGILVLGATAKLFLSEWSTAYAESLTLGGRVDITPAEQDVLFREVIRIIVPVFVPAGFILCACLIGSFLSGVAQAGGVSFHVESMAIQFEKLNPASNLQNIFGLRSIGRMGKSIIPSIALLAFGYESLKTSLITMPVMSMDRIPGMLSDSYGLFVDAGWIFLGWSAIDYVIEWRSWEHKLRMSKQEVREELKESMGNPQVRGRIRSIQRQIRRRRLKADVSRASVVITNPTHYAVALQFDFESLQAPTVLAKGRNLHAKVLKQEALWAGVPIVENPPLARSIYRTVPEGKSIPYELYAAVASILAYLYRQQVEEKIRRERGKKDREKVVTATRETNSELRRNNDDYDRPGSTATKELI